MNVQLDEGALAGLKSISRERKLSTAERIAIYAFHLKGVPAKIIARTFNVRVNAIYYITTSERTPAYANVKSAYDEMGEEKIWAEIVTPEQIESINDGMRRLLQGNFIDDRGRSRNPRRSPRPRRARAAPELPETGGVQEVGGSPSD